MRIFGNVSRHSKSIQTDRMHCPTCNYPLKILEKKDDGIYECYCAECQDDKVVKVIR